jgi:DNA primase
LRFHPNLTHGPTGTGFPAMVAGIQDHDGKLVAIHRTFLLPDGSGKAQVSTPKMALGPIGDCAVRLAKAGPILGLAEGIESGLSAQQLFDVPCWTALGSRLDRVWLPDVARHVVIYADNGTAGLEAAHKAVEAFTSLQRRVTLRLPPEAYGDWNDALQALEAEQIT